MMSISTFDELLSAARGQSQPQTLIMVFAGAELADDSTPEQRARFEAGDGGALVPLMAVEKSPGDIADFAALEAESRQFGKDWVIVFVAALAGRNGAAPASAEVEQAQDRMMESIRQGRLSAFAPFDRQGQPVQFS